MFLFCENHHTLAKDLGSEFYILSSNEVLGFAVDGNGDGGRVGTVGNI